MDGSNEIGSGEVLVGQPIWSAFRPRWFRLALAFLAAPSAASIFFAVTMIGLWYPPPSHRLIYARVELFFGFSLLLTLPGSVIFGGPLYALLIGWVRPRITAATLGGACIGAIIGVIGLCVFPEGFYRLGFRGYILSLNFLRFAVIFGSIGGLAGGFGGIMFWLCAIWRDPDFHGARRDVIESGRDEWLRNSESI